LKTARIFRTISKLSARPSLRARLVSVSAKRSSKLAKPLSAPVDQVVRAATIVVTRAEAADLDGAVLTKAAKKKSKAA
jgi:hypothetical protein